MTSRWSPLRRTWGFAMGTGDAVNVDSTSASAGEAIVEMKDEHGNVMTTLVTRNESVAAPERREEE